MKGYVLGMRSMYICLKKLLNKLVKEIELNKTKIFKNRTKKIVVNHTFHIYSYLSNLYKKFRYLSSFIFSQEFNFRF